MGLLLFQKKARWHPWCQPRPINESVLMNTTAPACAVLRHTPHRIEGLARHGSPSRMVWRFFFLEKENPRSAVAAWSRPARTEFPWHFVVMQPSIGNPRWRDTRGFLISRPVHSWTHHGKRLITREILFCCRVTKFLLISRKLLLCCRVSRSLLFSREILFCCKVTASIAPRRTRT